MSTPGAKPKFKIGQNVHVLPSRMSMAPTGRYKITRAMPAGGGATQYCVKREGEACERVVSEDLIELRDF
ncbi:MAG: hypothetical protein NW203_15625 [Hyphomonadaceae bacterium]|nr:hypothetical protein [Hyphomonadaceae bacterium]